jgi:hypothetical protein
VERAVPINRVVCPECGAGLKSAAGFKVGQTIACPKCETYFQVPAAEEDEPPSAARTTPLSKTKSLKPGAKPTARTAPLETEKQKTGKTTKVLAAKAKGDEDDEDEDRPKKKKKGKKKRRDDEEDGFKYSKSWIRVAVLGVLLIVLGVLSYMLYAKKQKEKEDNKTTEVKKEEDDTSKPVNRDDIARAQAANKGRKGGPVTANGPVVTPQPVAEPLTLDRMKERLTGTWVAKEGQTTHTIEYKSDGSFVYTRAGGGDEKTIEGDWSVDELITELGAPQGAYIRRKYSEDEGGRTERLPAQFTGPARLFRHAIPGHELKVHFEFQKK